MFMYLVIDNDSGEEFFVQANTREQCADICQDNGFFDFDIECRMTEEESEFYPYDVY